MSIHPTLRYDDVTSAITYLTTTFGLGEQEISTREDGSIAHAELSWEQGLVMLGPRSGPSDPFDTGRAVLYLPVDDVDAHHDRAVSAGADIASGLTDQPYGAREYAARDPEGNLWCFGTYRPTPGTAG